MNLSFEGFTLLITDLLRLEYGDIGDLIALRAESISLVRVGTKDTGCLDKCSFKRS